MIIPSQADYYVVEVDKSQQVVQVKEFEIIAWAILTDEFGAIGKPLPITIYGCHKEYKYIAHPTGIYTEVATGKQYKSKEWFMKCMQADAEEEKANG